MLIGVPVPSVGMQSSFYSSIVAKMSLYCHSAKGSLLQTWMTLNVGGSTIVVVLSTNWGRIKVHAATFNSFNHLLSFQVAIC